RARVGLHLRQPLERRRRLRAPPAAQARRAVRPPLARDGARRGVPAPGGRRVRLPIRLRVTAAFALAMAVVLAGTGWFLYARLEAHLAERLDRDLRLRAQDLSALVAGPGGTLATASGGRLIEHGESYAQLLGAGNRVLDATVPLRGRSLLTGAELRAALERPLFAERALVPGLDEPSRLLATPLDRDGERLVLLVGVTKGDDAETLAGL